MYINTISYTRCIKNLVQQIPITLFDVHARISLHGLIQIIKSMGREKK